MRIATIAALLLLLTVSACRAQPTPGLYPLETIKLPPGFHISLFAGNVANARQMALGANGTLFVGTQEAGVVYAIVDRDHDGVADEGLVIAAKLRAPNGVAFHDKTLFVGDASRVLRFDDIESRLEHPPKPVVIYDDY